MNSTLSATSVCNDGSDVVGLIAVVDGDVITGLDVAIDSLVVIDVDADGRGAVVGSSTLLMLPSFVVGSGIPVSDLLLSVELVDIGLLLISPKFFLITTDRTS
ncbi:hypothetical protein [Endozoicomonas sp. SCSIO W0465]|uniref:hypothetical protein n=1 Tax=Endozoicomonas sp. SCSIO W0465 TaxID=2918516 RepID=UPI0020759F16|nr:hypothetical protein [Endozoicomonas sp. SCSIO W0465]USE34382.1 hypothetical protein MJO57_19800 [Endozoicomonas sp. SCSIO W0465]